MAHSYGTLVFSRLALGIVGAGFVVGIRMIAEWFPKEKFGLVEGIYGGWGNFGAAAAAMALPVLATAIASGPGAWRWGIGMSGLAAAVYGLVFLLITQDTPDGVTYARPKKASALAVSSRGRCGYWPRCRFRWLACSGWWRGASTGSASSAPRDSLQSASV